MGGSSTILLLIFLIPAALLPGAMGTIFEFTNRCREVIYPGVLTNPGKPGFPTTGFALPPGPDAAFRDVPAGWSGRIWGRYRCANDASGSFGCASGDCGTGRVECNGAGNQAPSTLAEFTLNGQDGKDFYDISNVDGFNVPIQILPYGQTASCATVTCAANINAACPPELAARAADGSTVGCRSACLAFNTDEFCCRGEYGSPDRCRPNSYSQLFKAQCPQAYSYAYDDRSSTFTCSSGGNYQILFCP
ncbi:Thaumatin-like protein 1 [Dichanthelium oligosanthes]|uniref:Thaumatin-like protein 1 n=1 Tax=Dichanthelium oligosanthes TaxID=888268 RepID=A0A1E5VXK9_9POAL|nr:Thaumatin-like protein 1 [Dichanthelium oligosanthes]